MPKTKKKGLIGELRRRNVFRAAIAYLAVAWLLIQVAETILPAYGYADSVIRTMVALAAILFIPTLVFAWLFEFTADGFVRDSELDHEVASSTHPGRKFDFAIIGLLSIALIYFISTHNWREQEAIDPTGHMEKSVAVLPFDNLSGNPDNESLSDGITETMLHALAQLPDLKVPARTSSFYFKDKDVDIGEIAEQLGVKYVLEGSIQRDGDTIRVVAQLIEAETGFHLWSRTYDKDMNDIFAVQDDIASSVAFAMEATMAGDAGGGRIETISTDNVAAYDAYLLGQQQRSVGNIKSLMLAEISFREALVLDPDFYEATLSLADTYLSQSLVGETTEADARALVKPLLERLRKERPDDILTRRLEIRLWHIEGEQAEEYLAQVIASIAQKPNETLLYQETVLVLGFLERREEAIEWLNRGIAVDPLNWNLRYMLARRLERVGDLDGAEAAYEKAIELNPNNSNIYSMAANIHWARKQYGKAFSMERKAMLADPFDYEVPADIAIILYQFGLLDEGDKYLDRAITRAPDKPYVRTASLYQFLLQDELQKAHDMSEKMLRDEIEDRFFAYQFAAMVFMSVMTERGEIEKALAVLEELRPGISSPNFRPDNGRDWALQYHAVLALAKTQSKDETLNMLDGVVRNWDDSFPRWRNDPGAVAVVEMVRGNTDLAIRLTIENLEGRAGREILLYRLINSYKELAQEPTVAERLAELDAETKHAREVIWTHIVEQDLQL